MRKILCLTFFMVSCGSVAATPSASVAPSATPAATPTPSATPAATSAQLMAVAKAVYPACPSSCPTSGTSYTTCEAGGSDLFAACPITDRLKAQLNKDIQGVPSAPDPLGGGQDPYWATETITADATATGGVAHVVLGNGSSSNKTDLLIVVSGGKLLVDDIYCTSSDPATTDAYAAGWLDRSTCSA